MTGKVRIRRTDDETYHYLVDMVEDLTGSTTPGNGPSCFACISATTASGSPGCFRTTSPPGAPARAGPTCRITMSWAGRDFASRRSTGSPSNLGVATIYRSAAERFPTLRVAFNRLSEPGVFPERVDSDKILRNL